MDPALEIRAADGVPTRLDKALARHFPAASRRAIRELIATGSVRLNGRRARKGEMVRAGDRIRVSDPGRLGPAPLRPQPDLPVRVIAADRSFVAVDKPAGMPSLALRSRPENSVANFLVGRFPALRAVGAQLEGGLVHRLDTGTSGVLLAARTTEAYRALRRCFRQRAVEKLYLALVEGDIGAAGSVTTPIAPASRSGRRMSAGTGTRRARTARQAITEYRPLCRYGSATLLAITIATGVRHQIRVHLASIGHPILGDALYGAKERSASRPLLHARELRFPHPRDGKLVTIEAPLPSDFVAAQEELQRATR